jgi:hypothetical protein
MSCLSQVRTVGFWKLHLEPLDFSRKLLSQGIIYIVSSCVGLFCFLSHLLCLLTLRYGRSFFNATFTLKLNQKVKNSEVYWA